MYRIYTKNSIYVTEGTECLAVLHRNGLKLQKHHKAVGKHFLHYELINPHNIQKLVGTQLCFLYENGIFRSSRIDRVETTFNEDALGIVQKAI